MVIHDEVKCKAILAALNLTEYPDTKAVYDKLNCWSCEPDVYLPLMDILQTLCKRPVMLKKAVRSDGIHQRSDVSKTGWKMYNKLIVWIYELSSKGIIHDGSKVIQKLDEIIDEEP